MSRAPLDAVCVTAILRPGGSCSRRSNHGGTTGAAFAANSSPMRPGVECRPLCQALPRGRQSGEPTALHGRPADGESRCRDGDAAPIAPATRPVSSMRRTTAPSPVRRGRRPPDHDGPASRPALRVRACSQTTAPAAVCTPAGLSNLPTRAAAGCAEFAERLHPRRYPVHSTPSPFATNAPRNIAAEYRRHSEDIEHVS